MDDTSQLLYSSHVINVIGIYSDEFTSQIFGRFGHSSFASQPVFATPGGFLCSYVNGDDVQRKQMASEVLSEIETTLQDLDELQIFEYVSKNRLKMYELAVAECGPAAGCTPEGFRQVMLKTITRNADTLSSQGELLMEHQLETAAKSGIKIRDLIPYSTAALTTTFMLSISFKMISKGLSVSFNDFGKSMFSASVIAALYGTGKVMTKLVGEASYLIGRKSSFARLLKESAVIDLSLLKSNVDFSKLLSDLHGNLTPAGFEQANSAMKEYGAAKILVEEYYHAAPRANLASAFGLNTSTVIAWSRSELESIKAILEKNLPTLTDRIRFLNVTRLASDELQHSDDSVRDQYIRALLELP